MSNPDFDLKKLDLVFVDLEMTGLTLDKEIIEIGFVRAKAGTHEVLTERDIKIKPSRIESADPAALEVNGYNAEEWEREGMSLTEGLTEFLRHTENTMLVGHNLLPDWMFLQKSIEECGLVPNYIYKGLDTVSLAWLLLRGRSEIERVSLKELSKFFSVDQGHAHRAIDDARATYHVFMNLLKEYDRQREAAS